VPLPRQDHAWRRFTAARAIEYSGNLIVMIYDNDDGQQLDFDNQGVNQLGQNGAGTEHYHSGGNQKFLKVVSTCDWTIKVTKA
jgi:hypothetical protein